METASMAAYQLAATAASGITMESGLPPQTWDWMTPGQFYIIVAANIAFLIGAVVWLRVLWPSPTDSQNEMAKQLNAKMEKLQEEYGAIPKAEVQHEGDAAGDYSAPWTETFDLVFLLIMIGALIILLVWTQIAMPQLWSDPWFWLSQFPKLGAMMSVSLMGGALCRYYCDVDEKGYIVTSSKSWFKVNYTRKLQHFAAYMVPLLLHNHEVHGPLTLAWGDWFTLCAFLSLIKPVRELKNPFGTFIMLQWNSLDRPEDRPNTMKWIVGGNILPGICLIVFFRYLLSFTGQQNLAYVFVFITGLGDGLAEPVGITWGTHKYFTTSCAGDGRRYRRSLEGSMCVAFSGIFFASCLYSSFASARQFWCAAIILPPVMAYAEATSPHTMDTPFLMGLGGLILFAICHVDVLWLE